MLPIRTSASGPVLYARHAAIAHYSHGRGLVMEWLAVLAEPTAFLAALLVAYPLAYPACAEKSRALPLAVTLAAIALTGLGGWRAWIIRHAVGAEPTTSGGRAAFLATSAVVLNVTFAVVLIAMMIPAVVLRPCD